MKFKKITLKNGLRVVTVPMKDNPTVTVLVLVEAGSKYESKKIKGLSHFLEHMCFKGTQKRPKAIDIAKELDAIGSQYNAFTSHEYTGYYAKSDKKHFKQVLDIISDIYLNASFPEAEVEREKGVIIEEINMYEDMPSSDVQDLFTTLLYGDQPAGWKILGKKKNILAIKRGDFIKYKKEHYVPSATTIIIAGCVDERIAQKEIRKIFEKIKSSKKFRKVKVKESQKKPAISVKYKKTDQAHFVLGVRTYNIFSKKNSTMSLLGGVLGAGMSSRLFTKLREEMGVGYYVRAYNNPFTDHGFFQISAGVDNKRLNEVLSVVIEECNKLKNELVSGEELEKVKECLIGNMKLSIESSDDIANFYGVQELLKKEIKTPKQRAEDLRNVTAGQIQKLAREIFLDEKLNLALIGPFKEKKQFVKILKF